MKADVRAVVPVRIAGVVEFVNIWAESGLGFRRQRRSGPSLVVIFDRGRLTRELRRMRFSLEEPAAEAR